MKERTGSFGTAVVIATALLVACGGSDRGTSDQAGPGADQAGPGPDTSQTPRTDCWGDASGQDGCAPIPLPDVADLPLDPGPWTPDSVSQSDGPAPSDVEVPDICVPDCAGTECGDDGCGASCGECASPAVCDQGTCVEVECWDGNDIPWDGCNAGKIAEFKVNEYWLGAQAHPAVATGKDGAFVVAWDGSGEGDDKGVWLRTFGTDGQPEETEVLVNEFTFGDQELPSVAMLEGGEVVVAWNGSGDEDDHGIYMRRCGKDGQPLGQQESVNTFTSKNQDAANVTALDGGGFVVAWASLGKIMFNHEICARTYLADGTPAGDEWIVNVVQDNDQQAPVLAATPGGGLAVAWASKPQDGSDYGVFARLFDAAGVPQGDDTQVNEYAMGVQWTPWIAPLAGGGFSVVWGGETAHDDFGVAGRLLDDAGALASAEIAVNTATEAEEEYDPCVVGLVDGRFAVAWESFTPDYIDPDAEGEVYMRIFGPAGEPLASEGDPINTFFYDGQGDPAIAAFDDGGWLVVWYSFAQDGNERGIFAQRFDADGKKIQFWK